MLGHMPFAGEVGRVAGGFQNLGDRNAAPVEVSLVALEAAVIHHVADTCLVGVETGQQRCAGGAAAPGIVELGQADSPGGEAVEIRGLDLAPIAADIAEAHVIGHHDNDVGTLCCALAAGG